MRRLNCLIFFLESVLLFAHIRFSQVFTDMAYTSCHSMTFVDD